MLNNNTSKIKDYEVKEKYFVHDDINNQFELFGRLIEEYYEDTKVINKIYKETAVMAKELEVAVS